MRPAWRRRFRRDFDCQTELIRMTESRKSRTHVLSFVARLPARYGVVVLASAMSLQPAAVRRWIRDEGFGIQDSVFRIQYSVFSIQDSVFSIQDSGLMCLWVNGDRLCIRLSCLSCASCYGSGLAGLGIRIKGVSSEQH